MMQQVTQRDADVILINSDQNDKYVCFWSTDAAGNVGKGVSEQISGVAGGSFVSVWSVPSNSKSIRLPLESDGEYNFTVDWGDGTVEQVTSYNSDNASHDYTDAGVKMISIIGKIKGFNFKHETYNSERSKLG